MKNTMQLSILFGLALALTAGAAFADFRPGRVRPGTISEMRTVVASGIYERESGARLELNYEDGKAKPVSLTLKQDGQEALTLPIIRTQLTNCGNTYVAEAPSNFSSTGVSLTLVDYSRIQCKIFVANAWHLEVAQVEGNAGEGRSIWKLEGHPQDLVGTLSTRF